MLHLPVIGRNSGHHLNLGGSGDIKDKLLIGALAVVIAGAVVALAMSIIGGGEKKGPNLPDSYHLQCMACNQEFDWSAEEYNAEVRKMGEEVLAAPAVAFECIKCHNPRKSAFPMSRCPYPDCGKWYTPNRVMRLVGKPIKEPQVCPNCGKDLVEGYRLNAGKKR